MKISPAGVDLIKGFESLQLVAYQDSVGVWTVGYGHTRNAHRGQAISPEEAEVLLVNDLAVTEGILNIAITHPVTQNQWDACVSLAFNIGSGNFTKSTLLKKLNAGELGKRIAVEEGNLPLYDGAAGEFSRWIYAGVKVLPGLVKRRLAEQRLFVRDL